MGIEISDLSPEAQRQVIQKLGIEMFPQQGKSKYNNVKEKRGEVSFDSRKEARRYDELMILLRAGEIRNLRLQPQFTLQESYITPTGERVRAIRYVADFSYERRTLGINGEAWITVVEDVKSSATRTAQYKLKRKLLLERFGVSITEV